MVTNTATVAYDAHTVETAQMEYIGLHNNKIK